MHLVNFDRLIFLSKFVRFFLIPDTLIYMRFSCSVLFKEVNLVCSVLILFAKFFLVASLTALFKHVESSEEQSAEELSTDNICEKAICFMKDKVNTTHFVISCYQFLSSLCEDFGLYILVVKKSSPALVLSDSSLTSNLGRLESPSRTFTTYCFPVSRKPDTPSHPSR